MTARTTNLDGEFFERYARDTPAPQGETVTVEFPSDLTGSELRRAVESIGLKLRIGAGGRLMAIRKERGS